MYKNPYSCLYGSPVEFVFTLASLFTKDHRKSVLFEERFEKERVIRSG